MIDALVQAWRRLQGNCTCLCMYEQTTGMAACKRQEHCRWYLGLEFSWQIGQ